MIKCFYERGGIMLYNQGDFVVYAGSSVCRISEIKPMYFGASEKPYYILKPVFEPQSTVYHPVDGPDGKLRFPIDAQEASRIVSAPVSDNWIDNDNERREAFTETLKNGSCAEVVAMVKLIFRRKSRIGAKLRASDERALNDGKKLISEELAFALKITKDEAVAAVLG